MPGIVDEFDSRVRFALVDGLAALAVMTDGVADDFFPEAQRLGELFDGQPIHDLKTLTGDDVVGLLHGARRTALLRRPAALDGSGEPSYLLDWLQYEKKGSSDDRTLALLYRKQGENA